MSQKNTGRNVGGYLLTDADLAFIEQQVRNVKPLPGGSLQEAQERERRRLSIQQDEGNRSRRGHNRLVRAGQVASAAPLALAGGAALAGGGGVTSASVPGVVAGAPVTSASQAAAMGLGVPTVTAGGGSMAATLGPEFMVSAPMSVASGVGSEGARRGIMESIRRGGTMDNLLKIGKAGTDLGFGIWANKAAGDAERASLEMQRKNHEELLAWEREKDQRDRADQAKYDAELQRRWELEQQNQQRKEDLELLTLDDKYARRAPYREASYNAMARLSGINGLPIPARPAPPKVPGFIARNTMSTLSQYRG